MIGDELLSIGQQAIHEIFCDPVDLPLRQGQDPQNIQAASERLCCHRERIVSSRPSQYGRAGNGPVLIEAGLDGPEDVRHVLVLVDADGRRTFRHQSGGALDRSAHCSGVKVDDLDPCPAGEVRQQRGLSDRPRPVEHDDGLVREPGFQHSQDSTRYHAL